MSLLDRVKTQAEETATKAREGVQDVQTKRELNQAYTDLGKTAFALVERGEISHPEFGSAIDRINECNARLKDEAEVEPAIS